MFPKYYSAMETYYLSPKLHKHLLEGLHKLLFVASEQNHAISTTSDNAALKLRKHQGESVATLIKPANK